MPPRLIATSDVARQAIDGDSLTIDHVPFRIGRDSRGPSGRLTSDVERRMQSVGRTNDVYFFEDPLARFHHVSREHFLIDMQNGRYFVEDRHSVCGTIVAGKTVGGDRAGGRAELHDQDVIVVGTPASPYVFKFVVS